MALSTVAALKTWLGETATTNDNSYASILTEVEAAIKRRLRNNIERASYTAVLNAPPSEFIALAQTPVLTTGLSVYYRAGARGDTALFTSDYLLTRGTDYILETDPDNATQSRSGRLMRLFRLWGAATIGPVNSLVSRIEEEPGSVYVSWTAGYSPIPHDLVLAVHLATIALFRRRKFGAMMTSENWNGYGYSIGQGPATAESVLDSPEIAGLWRPFGPTAGVFVA